MNHQTVASALLDWFDQSGRSLPWRAQKEQTKNPYFIWLSEIMLQQTTVATVYAYFNKFTQKWPTVFDLAKADIDDVLREWAGLGYYSRAHNLHKCAKVIVQKFDGIVPSLEKELLELPGVGPYTAAAISAIAYDQPNTIVDGNVERVISRLFLIEEPLPTAKPLIREKAMTLTPKVRPGNYAEAIMDLGATVCKPQKPMCILCPLQSFCKATKVGRPEDYPRRLPKSERPVRKATLFWVESEGHIILRKRPLKGLLGGLWELPSTPWDTKTYKAYADNPDMAPFMPVQDEAIKWIALDGFVTHQFTHFQLEMTILKTTLNKRSQEHEWVHLQNLDQYALPTMIQKALKFARNSYGKIGS
jgi:A/G-specific adenine glycosylase